MSDLDVTSSSFLSSEIANWLRAELVRVGSERDVLERVQRQLSSPVLRRQADDSIRELDAVLFFLTQHLDGATGSVSLTEAGDVVVSA